MGKAREEKAAAPGAPQGAQPGESEFLALLRCLHWQGKASVSLEREIVKKLASIDVTLAIFAGQKALELISEKRSAAKRE